MGVLVGAWARTSRARSIPRAMVAWTSSGERPCVFTALSESSDGLPTGNRMADRDGPVLRPACHRADGRSFGTAIDRCDPVEHDGDDFP
jgi:hypothetical protein